MLVLCLLNVKYFLIPAFSGMEELLFSKEINIHLVSKILSTSDVCVTTMLCAVMATLEKAFLQGPQGRCLKSFLLVGAVALKPPGKL